MNQYEFIMILSAAGPITLSPPADTKFGFSWPAPIFAIAIHAALGKKPGVLQGLSLGFALLSLYAAYRGLTAGVRVDNVFVPLWSNFIVAPSFYLSPLMRPSLL